MKNLTSELLEFSSYILLRKILVILLIISQFAKGFGFFIMVSFICYVFNYFRNSKKSLFKLRKLPSSVSISAAYMPSSKWTMAGI